MSLFTSSASTLASRATVAYFLAIFILLGGLASLHNYGDRTSIFDVQQSKAPSAKFSWDMVRIRIDLLNCTSIVDPTIASTCK